MDAIKADSGATNFYLKPDHMTYLSMGMIIMEPAAIHLPDNSNLSPTYKGYLNLHPDLLQEAQKVFLPGLTNFSFFQLAKPVTEILCSQKTTYT